MGTTPFLKKSSTSIVEATLQEFIQEAAITRRVLARVPADKLTWTPHPKSMSLGCLALHIASGPGTFVQWITAGVADLPSTDSRPQPATVEAILSAHEESLAAVKRTLAGLDEADVQGLCTLRKNGATFMNMPRLAVLRTLVMNHWIHHRGQLSVYLRLLDVPVPSLYGPSADERPFTNV